MITIPLSEFIQCSLIVIVFYVFGKHLNDVAFKSIDADKTLYFNIFNCIFAFLSCWLFSTFILAY